MPVHAQKAFDSYRSAQRPCPISAELCSRVLSLPMHSEMDAAQLAHIQRVVVDVVRGPDWVRWTRHAA